MFWWLPAADVVDVVAFGSGSSSWPRQGAAGVTVYSPLHGSIFPPSRPVPVLFRAAAPPHGGRVRVLIDGRAAAPDVEVPPPTTRGGGRVRDVGRLPEPLSLAPGAHVLTLMLIADDSPAACSACVGPGDSRGDCSTCGELASEVSVEFAIGGGGGGGEDPDEDERPADPRARVSPQALRNRSFSQALASS